MHKIIVVLFGIFLCFGCTNVRQENAGRTSSTGDEQKPEQSEILRCHEQDENTLSFDNTHFDQQLSDEDAAAFLRKYQVGGQWVTLGTKREGIPYDGYFPRMVLSEPMIVDLYQAGVRIKHFSQDLLLRLQIMEGAIPVSVLNLNIESRYRCGHVVQGRTYQRRSSKDGSTLTVREVERGKLVQVDVWLFGMHYGERLRFTKTDTGFHMSTLREEDGNEHLHVISTPEGGHVQVFRNQDKVVDNRFIEITQGQNFSQSALGSEMRYFIVEGKLHALQWFTTLPKEHFDNIDNRWFPQSEAMRLLWKAMPFLHSLENIAAVNFLETRKLLVSRLYIDQEGKPRTGIHVEPMNEGKGYTLSAYHEGVLEPSVEGIAADELRETVNTLWNKMAQ